MGRRQRESRVEIVRRLLLVALVIFLGVVSAMFYLQRSGTPGEVEQREVERRSGLRDLVRSGEGFEYEVTERERSLFNIRAERILESRDDLFVLEKVAVEVTREDGVTYEVSADKGLYRAEENDKSTNLDGNAVVRSSSGAEVRSDGFALRRKGRLVTSTSPVEYRLGDRLRGTANNLEAFLKRDRYQLSGDVAVVGGPEDPSFRLRCRRLIYEEKNRRIYAEGDVFLARQGVELRAGRITVTLSEDGRDIRFIRARYNVSGFQVFDDDLQSFSRFEANELALAYDEATGKISRAELDARPAERVFVESADATQLARRLTAPRLLMEFENGEPSRFEAFRKVEIKEYLVFAPRVILLLTCSKSAVAQIIDGRFGEIQLWRGVDIHQLDMQAVGDRVVRKSAGEVTEIEGDPAAIFTPRGDLLAPSITHFGAGRARASGGVRATMTRGGGFEMIRDSEGEESPIRVTAREAAWSETEDSVIFSGDVRAWQGDDFIVAERLSAEEGGDRLHAERNVKTVITSKRRSDPEATPEERAPVEVTAGEMTYERSARRLRYFESPIARQAGRTLACSDLALTFDAEQEFERMVCRGGVVIEDPTENRSIRGDVAVYTPGKSLLEVGGTPAFLQNPDGVEVRGSVVVYDLESGRANVRAGDVVLDDEGGPDR